MSRLVDTYEGSFVLVQYHVLDQFSAPWSDERWAQYDGDNTPLAVFNGTDPVEGAIEDIDQQYEIYRLNHFLPRRALPTDVTLELSGADVGGGVLRMSVEVAVEPGDAARTLRIYLVQVLNRWPPDHEFHRNGFKGAALPADVTLAPGESTTVTRDFTLDADSLANLWDVRVVAWAQAPSALGPGEVLQAAERRWPLAPAPDDDDGDLVHDTEDNCPHHANTNQLDGDGDGIGDACDLCPATPDPGQADGDEDGWGDACDSCPDLHHRVQDDQDGDGLGDPCDSCPEVVAQAGIDSFGRSLGTIDADCDVDPFDAVLLSGCVGGPEVRTPPSGCATDTFSRSDLDGDGDVDMHDHQVLALNFTGPLASPALYVGAETCVGCHPAEHGLWVGTIHASAFSTLVASGDGDNPLCFPCHAVGYARPSGFVDALTTPHLTDVQCETCHGPGSNHASDPDLSPLTVDLDSSLCGACHQSCHGLCGADHHPQHEQWLVSSHARALTDLRDHPSAEDGCVPCHSTDARLAPPGSAPTLATAVFDVECVACHSPHGSAHVGQLRLAPRHLCAECHTMGDSLPTEEPHQPQAEVLHGTGGFQLDGAPLSGPHTQHWWGVPDECAHCHVHSEPYGGPDQPVNSGHTFVANRRACAPCHQETVAAQLAAAARLEVETRLAELATYLDPGHPNFVDPSTLPPDEQARHAVAVFDVQLAAADRSFGAHNPAYTRRLLAEAEEFFGVAPWKTVRPVASHSPSEGGGEGIER